MILKGIGMRHEIDHEDPRRLGALKFMSSETCEGHARSHREGGGSPRGHSNPHAAPVSVLFFIRGCTVSVRRYQNLEPCTRSPAAILADDYAGKREDLPDQEQAKTRIQPFPFLEDGLLLLIRDADPVVFVDDDKPVHLFVT